MSDTISSVFDFPQSIIRGDATFEKEECKAAYRGCILLRRVLRATDNVHTLRVVDCCHLLRVLICELYLHKGFFIPLSAVLGHRDSS
ncbi:hypothetical protein J6590_034841 [Homalodisca vitripennis]|nr:hypothetical protein J6590_034841 [Homalodisca vitripennis]